MRARARPLFLRTIFQILFRISQSNGKNENSKTGISALKSVFGFCVRLQIRNPDFQNLNPDFPIERAPGEQAPSENSHRSHQKPIARFMCEFSGPF